MGEAIAKPRLPMAFLGQIEERDRLFPRVRLLVLIKDDKYVLTKYNHTLKRSTRYK